MTPAERIVRDVLAPIGQTLDRYKHHEAHAQMIAAAQAGIDRAREVKPLVWDIHDVLPPSVMLTAQTSLGEYVIEYQDSRPEEQWGLWTPDEDGIASWARSWHATETDAKAAAQADYTARILAALKGDDE